MGMEKSKTRLSTGVAVVDIAAVRRARDNGFWKYIMEWHIYEQ